MCTQQRLKALQLGAIVDMAALKQARETARRVDRHYLDKRCTHVLNSSKGDHDLLEVSVHILSPVTPSETRLAIANPTGRDATSLGLYSKGMYCSPHGSHSASLTCRQRLPAVQIQSERRMLETSLQALERRSARKHNLPDEFIITRPDILVHRNLKLGQGGFARVYEADWRGTRVAVKELESDIPISVSLMLVAPW